MQTAEIRRRFLEHFAAARAHRRPQRLADLPGPVAAVHRRRHGAVHPVPDRPGARAVPARDQRAEVRPHPRHRGGRQDHPARHVLPDERQLLLRRLLQGRRDPARLGADHRDASRTAGWASTPTRSGPRSTSTTTRPPTPGTASPACRRSASSASARRTTTGPPAPPARPARARRSTSTAAREFGPDGGPAGRHRRRPVPGDLEPRLHAVRDRRGAQQGGLPRSSASCRRRTSTPAWAWSGWPSCCRASTTCTRSTRSPRCCAAPPSSPGSRYGARPRGRRPAARRRRPRAQRPDAHRRRRHAGQRGRRLHPAPAAAPRRPLDEAARRRRGRRCPSCCRCPATR